MSVISICLLTFGKVNTYFTQALSSLRFYFSNHIHFNTLSDLIATISNPRFVNTFQKYSHLLIWNVEYIPVKLIEENGNIKVGSIDSQAVNKLLLVKAPVVSAYCKYKTIRAVVDEFGNLPTREYLLDWAPIVPVYATSSDFLLLDTKVLNYLVTRWDIVPNPTRLTEDYLITYKLRKLGFEPIINIDVVCVKVVEKLEF